MLNIKHVLIEKSFLSCNLRRKLRKKIFKIRPLFGKKNQIEEKTLIH